MKQQYSALVLCLTIFLLASCSGLTQSKIAGIDKEILKVHAELTAAAENRDADAMFAYILDSDETVIQTGDVAQTRQQALESVRRSFQQFSSIRYEFDEKQVTVLSQDSAEMTVRGRSIDTTADGRVLRFSFTQEILFVFTDNGWKIKHAHHIPEND